MKVVTIEPEDLLVIPSNSHPLRTITPRMLEVIERIAEGKTNCQIADELNVSALIIKNQIYEIMQRLEAKNRAHVIVKAIVAGILKIGREDGSRSS